MKTEVEKLEKNKVLLKVEVPLEMMLDAFKWAYKSIAHQVNIPGFRKGSAPPEIIDRRLGTEAVKNEVLKQLLPSYYLQAVQESGIEPIDQPQIEIEQLEKEKPFLFKATVEIKPEVKLGDYSGLKLARLPAVASEEEVAERLEHLRNRFAQLQVVEGRRPLIKGDFALIDFKGFVGDIPYEKGAGTDYLLEIGSGTFVPGFEDQLVGAKKGEIREVKVTFPQDYQFEEVAGKEVRFNVLVKEIKVKILPELNDEFAKEAGEFESLEALKNDLKEKLQESKKVRSDMALRAAALRQVSENAEVEVSQTMKDRRTEELLAQFSQNLRNQGINMEDYLKATKSEFETLKQSLEEEAVSGIKTELVVEAIAKKENVEATDEEIDEEINSYAKLMGKSLEEAKKMIEEKGNMWLVREDVVKSKTLDWLLEHAVIEEAPAESEKKERKAGKKRQSRKTKEEVKEDSAGDADSKA